MIFSWVLVYDVETLYGFSAKITYPEEKVGVPFFQVDAFVTGKPFSGNPAGVCVLPGPAEEAWMQSLAFEINQAETAFLHPEGDGYRLRWFTPKMEISLCGHATLASAHVLWSGGFLGKGQEARFYTKSGLLKAGQKGDLIELDFPATPAAPCEKEKGLEESLGAPVLSLSRYKSYYLAELPSDKAVRQLKPDFKLMESVLNQKQLVEVAVTAATDDPAYDFVSRFFAPVAGISEDHVTGSAHCCLGPFWQNRLGKNTFAAFQASARGGVLTVRCENDRVYLGGQARTVVRGELASA
jgi:PhzF family phenazine biosynthesis protein